MTTSQVCPKQGLNRRHSEFQNEQRQYASVRRLQSDGHENTMPQRLLNSGILDIVLQK